MSNDLISREALKEALHNFFDGKVIDEPAYILRDVFCYIDSAPTVFDDKAYSDGYTQGTCDCEHAHERPQGEWIAHEDMDEWYECNKCHCGNTYFDKLPNFCPNCGADMQKGGAE